MRTTEPAQGEEEVCDRKTPSRDEIILDCWRFSSAVHDSAANGLKRHGRSAIKPWPYDVARAGKPRVGQKLGVKDSSLPA